MTMKTDFQNLATKLITGVFGSVAQSVIIRRPIYSNYDEETGSMISATEDYTVTGIVGPWVDDNIAALTSSTIRSDDLSLIISKQTLEIEPEVNYDIAILNDGSEYAIVYSEKDPAEATITFRLSKDVEGS